MIANNLNTIQNIISETCKQSGRDEKEVTLIAVSKTKPVEMIWEAYNAGIRDFGENKVQEMCDKMEQLPKDIRWHMIGHLQRNKVKYIVGKTALIHSVDSLRLAEEINKQAEKKNVVVDILIEVNMGREETKFGVFEEDTTDLLLEVSKMKNIRVRGLMTSAPYVDDFDENLEIFHKIKQLSVDIDNKNIDNISMEILSMGMSQDYIAAIKEGSTMVRLGTVIFGNRNYDI